MKKERNYRPSRKMRPLFLVFCEGDTEETYINLLRQKYRLPIKVISRITGLSISPSIIQRFIQAEKIGPGDLIKSFLMYDLDIKGIAQKLETCKSSISIVSNPSVELWFLLHSYEQNAAITSDSCIEKLKKAAPAWEYYKKGTLSERQKLLLWNNRITASTRAKCLPAGENPSSSVFRLIETMDNVTLQEVKKK